MVTADSLEVFKKLSFTIRTKLLPARFIYNINTCKVKPLVLARGVVTADHMSKLSLLAKAVDVFFVASIGAVTQDFG